MRRTYDGENGGEEEEVVCEDWRKVITLAPARRHFEGKNTDRQG